MKMYVAGCLYALYLYINLALVNEIMCQSMYGWLNVSPSVMVSFVYLTMMLQSSIWHCLIIALGYLQLHSIELYWLFFLAVRTIVNNALFHIIQIDWLFKILIFFILLSSYTIIIIQVYSPEVVLNAAVTSNAPHRFGSI